MEGRVPLFHVPGGTFSVATAPAEIRTIVGSGFVVALWSRDGNRGGLLHLQSSTLPSGEEIPSDCCDKTQIQATMDAFLAEFHKDNENEECFAEIIGGADIHRALPFAEQNNCASRCVEFLRAHLDTHGIRARVRPSSVGGTHQRTIHLSLSSMLEPGTALNIYRAGESRESHPPAALPEHNPPIEAAESTTVAAGELVVGRSPAEFVAVLGSCVGVAISDTEANVGGFAHVMIPESNGQGHNPARYADTAVDSLVDALKAEGANPRRMRAIIAGGANVLASYDMDSPFRVGQRNAAIVRREIRAHNIPILQEDLGGRSGRKIRVRLREFEMDVKLLPNGLASYEQH